MGGIFGGGKGGGSGGSPFPRNIRDVRRMISAQEDAAQRTLQQVAGFNFFDIYTPFGSRTFTGTPGSPGFKQTISLNPMEEFMLNQQRELRGGLGDLAAQQFEAFSPQFTSPIGGADLQQSAADLEQATFERGRNLLQPGFDLERQRLENSLIQRGLPRGSEAFQSEFDRLSQRQGGALEDLALSSVAAGRREQSRQLAADIQRRQAMLGEITGLGLGAPVLQPQFQPTPALTAQAFSITGPVST